MKPQYERALKAAMSVTKMDESDGHPFSKGYNLAIDHVRNMAEHYVDAEYLLEKIK